MGSLRRLALVSFIVALPSAAHAEFDPCWDSSGGCWSMPSPPVMSDPSPSSDGGNRRERTEPSIPTPNYYDDNRLTGIAKEQALANSRRVIAWRKKRENEVDDEIDRLISDRKAQIAQLKKSVAVWQRVAKRLPQGQDVQSELTDWAEQSEEAQTEAIRASVTLAAGAWAEKASLATIHYEAAENTYFKLHKELLDVQSEAEALAAKCVHDPKLAKALGDVAKALKDAQQTLGEGNIVRLHAIWTHEFYENCDAVLKLLHYGEAFPAHKDQLETEQQVRMLLAKIQAISIDNLADVSVDYMLDHAKEWSAKSPSLIDSGSATEQYLQNWTVYLRLGRFVGEYGLAATRFGLAWSNIEDLRTAIDDTNSKLDLAGKHIKADTDAMLDRQKELDWLKKAKGYGLDDKEDVIAAFNRFGRDRAKELNAELLGISIVGVERAVP